MTWTQINKTHFSKYEGMTPSDIGRSIISNPESYTTDLFIKQNEVFAHHPETDPYNYDIPIPAWQEFWKSIYDLKNKPKSEWTLDDWFGYRALDNLINYALARV
jgi:hypothetical protein